jgi:serine/threonine-protein kinase
LRALGRYNLYERIASGGMATVHLGRLRGPVGFARTVAIKRLHENFARNPEFVAMFVDEARLAARIRHPNVVDMLDVIATEGELFLVLGYVHGESLATLLRTARERNERVPLGIVSGILVGVLNGLHAAHEAKSERGEPLSLVHRDVSPHNVLVGVDGVPRLLDFGVAKAAGRMQESRAGQIKGKLAYMSPEQIDGRADCRTDLYAVSVILWEALTGKRLFTGDNEAMLLRDVLSGGVDAPSRWAPGISPALDALTLRGLSADPTARFASAREMARELERILPIASASVIGEWVDALEHDSLVERARRVELVEQSPAGSEERPLPEPSTTDEHDPALRPIQQGDATRSLLGETSNGATTKAVEPEVTQISSAKPAERRAIRIPGRWSWMLYGVAATAIIAAWVTTSRHPRAPVDASASPKGDATGEASTAAPPVSVSPVDSVGAGTADAMAPAVSFPAPRRSPTHGSQAPSPPRGAKQFERAIDSRK